MNPWKAVEDFEQALCKYTGAPYAVAVSSCTAAILLACARFQPACTVSVPKRTYISVPMAVIKAGHRVTFPEIKWTGSYRLAPLPVFDCALRFTSSMYRAGDYQCVSFAAAKILGLEQGGAILHDNYEADRWFRKMRFDGRRPGLEVSEDDIDLIGYHFPMLPSTAAALTLRLHHLPKHNPDQVREYPDISQKACFRVE